MHMHSLLTGLTAAVLSFAALAYEIPLPPCPLTVSREEVDDVYTEATRSEGTRRAALLCMSALGNMALGEQAMAAENSATLARDFPKSPFSVLLAGNYLSFPCPDCLGIKEFSRCAKCHGRGQLELMRGTAQKCLQCAGKGLISETCRTCNGRGVDRVSPTACALMFHELKKGFDATPGPVGQKIVSAGLEKLEGARRLVAHAERLSGVVNGQDASGVVLELTARATRESYGPSTDIVFLRSSPELARVAPGASISVAAFRDGKRRVAGVFGEEMMVDAYRLDPWPADEAPSVAAASPERVRGVPASVFRLISEDAGRRFPDDAAARENEISRLISAFVEIKP